MMTPSSCDRDGERWAYFGKISLSLRIRTGDSDWLCVREMRSQMTSCAVDQAYGYCYLYGLRINSVDSFDS